MPHNTSSRRPKSYRSPSILAVLFILTRIACATEYHGKILFNGMPVPGATVTATQGHKHLSIRSDSQGRYSFPDLADGVWNIHIEMQCFSSIDESVTISPNQAVGKWDLQLLSPSEIVALSNVVKTENNARPIVMTGPSSDSSNTSRPPTRALIATRPAEQASRPLDDGLLVNGSVNNAATSQFTLSPAFGNQRTGLGGLYNGGISLKLDNSALDAKSYSITGLDSPKPAYSNVMLGLGLGGPLNIPYVMPHGPNFFISYQWTRDRRNAIDTGLVPTEDERRGALPQGNVMNISPQALALLQYYPLPNAPVSSHYNYQVVLASEIHQDVLHARLDKRIGRGDELSGNCAFQSTRSGSPNLFQFLDVTDVLGIDANPTWTHHFNNHLLLNLGYHFSRLRTLVKPFFQGVKDVEADARIKGYDQEAAQWGPPTLSFSSGIAGLSESVAAFDRNRTDALSYSVNLLHRNHNFSFGGDFRRQEYNENTQQNPRGAFTFTGAASGVSDIEDFLQGSPDTTAVAFGNADKYLRQSVYDLFVNDEWNLLPELTLNIGLRWEYGAPITELFGRLVNIDAAPHFSGVAPVLGSAPFGSVTGQQYPSSLIRPDKRGIEPRLGLSWRPVPASSLVVRAGYGIYDDTSVYEATALAMAEQEPLSTSLQASYSSACPLTLAAGLVRQECTTSTPDNFGVDPNFRVGYAQTWQLSVQRDFPFALQARANYLGVKGTRGVQDFLPNTYPIGAPDPTPTYPVGFLYRTSNGNSTRESGSLQLRRRLRAGFTADAIYTYSKSLDDDAELGGQGPLAAGATSPPLKMLATAQDWLNLRAERGPSTFDQRHLLNASMQYSSGMGLAGGTLLQGWRGRALKDWTLLVSVSVGSGLPETPIYLASVPNTGVTGTIRPSITGAPIYCSTPGVHLNEGAYTVPATGQWGDAGRDSIRGPREFSFNASVQRTFRVQKKYFLDLRIDATNVMNHVTFTSWNATINSSLFGAPNGANPMRSTQVTTRLRF